MLFNGHFDTVVVDPIEDWTHGPWSGDIVDGRLYGRGSCDMKGGIAAALATAHALVAEGVELAGDLYFNVVPFEEVNGMGTIATMLRGYRADAAICCEPTELNTLIGCRGILLAELEIKGRSAHAEIIQPHHSEGGGVNAIDKLIDLLLAIRRMNDDWRDRPDKRHWLLSTPYVLTPSCRACDTTVPPRTSMSYIAAGSLQPPLPLIPPARSVRYCPWMWYSSPLIVTRRLPSGFRAISRGWRDESSVRTIEPRITCERSLR